MTPGRARSHAVMNSLTRPLIRAAVSAFQACRRTVWFFTTPQTFGVCGIPLTEGGAVVLVRLTYSTGWSLPAGRRKTGEAASDAIIRELKEEIGLVGFASLEPKGAFEHRPNYRRASTELFVIRGVRYRAPAWSLEVEEIGEFELHALPDDLPRFSRRQLQTAGLLPLQQDVTA